MIVFCDILLPLYQLATNILLLYHYNNFMALMRICDHNITTYYSTKVYDITFMNAQNSFTQFTFLILINGDRRVRNAPECTVPFYLQFTSYMSGIMGHGLWGHGNLVRCRSR